MNKEDKEATAVFIGVVLLIMFIVVGSMLHNALKTDKPPKPYVCKDYSYTLSRWKSDVATCKSDMEMEVQKRMLGADFVQCTCIDMPADAGTQ